MTLPTRVHLRDIIVKAFPALWCWENKWTCSKCYVSFLLYCTIQTAQWNPYCNKWAAYLL